MSEAVQIAIITSTASSVPTMVIGFLIYFRNRKRDKADIERDKLARDTHMLVNSGMGEQLLIAMVSAKNLAFAKPTKENIELSDVAEQKYKHHQAKQDRVDGRKTT